MSEKAVQSVVVSEFSDRDSAPIIFFDGAGPFGFYNNILHVTLATVKHLPAGEHNNEVAAHPVAVAFLRCNVQAATALRDALNNALLMATPPQGEAN